LVTKLKAASYSIRILSAVMTQESLRMIYFAYVYSIIKMDLREIGWDGVDWVDQAQDRDHWRALVNTVMNLRVP
jgi:hypothetical protein